MGVNGDRVSPRFDFQLLEESLISVQAPAGAAECHGLLCGMLCIKPRTSFKDWLDEALPELDTDKHEELTCLTAAREVYAETRRQLDSPDCDFRMLLPVNDAIAVRSDAMVSWCEGFLYGIGVVGGEETLKIDEGSREFISDLSEITRLATDAEEGEKNELAYTEIVEYVRTGVMLVREIGLSRRQAPIPRILH